MLVEAVTEAVSDLFALLTRLTTLAQELAHETTDTELQRENTVLAIETVICAAKWRNVVNPREE